MQYDELILKIPPATIGLWLVAIALIWTGYAQFKGYVGQVCVSVGSIVLQVGSDNNECC